VGINISFIQENIRTIAILLISVLGLAIILSARRARWGDVLSMVGFVLLGITLIVGGVWYFNAASDIGGGLFGS
jgi:hypothetical protein